MIIVLLIILLLVIGSFLLNALYKRTNHFRNQFIDVRKYSVKGGVGDNLEIVNVGSNHPKFGFDYSGLDIKGENWAVGPETFEYDFTVLRKNASHLAPGAVVVLPICLLKFFLYRHNNRAIHIKYYSFLKKEEIVGYTRKEQLSEFLFPLLFHPRRLRYLVKDVKKDCRLLQDNNSCKTVEELNQDADFWRDVWNKEFDIQLPSPTLSTQNKYDIQQNINILKEMIGFCTSRGLKPVIALLPVTNFLYSRFTPEFVDNFILGFIKEANQANAPLVNYLTDKRFTDPSLYINSFFFNSTGRKKFTKQFVEDLRAQSIL